MKLAWIGLGAMGYPIAGHLAGQFETIVINRSSEKAEKHAREFGSRAGHYSDLANADLIFSCLPVSKDVSEVVEAALSYVPKGSLWADCTSGEPQLSKEIASRLNSSGVGYLDACLSGGVIGALNKKSTVMCGGSVQDFERAKPVLEIFASTIVRVGGVGAGHSVKAINNALLAVNLIALAEGLVALVKQGVDPTLALQVINASSGRSNASENLFGQRVVSREFPNTFALGLLAKDMGIALEVARSADVDAKLLGLTKEIFETAKAEVGNTDVDHTAVVKLIEKWAHAEIKSKSSD